MDALLLTNLLFSHRIKSFQWDTICRNKSTLHDTDSPFEMDKMSAEEVGCVDKTQLLQEAKLCFMATSIKTKKLVDVLTKCIFILLQGESLANTEATDLFFHITRLFQYKDKDSTLRRLTYIGIKVLSQQADNVYVVTPSLTTDVTSREEPAIRASALRALCQISNASTFTSIERYLRQSIVDKHPVVASAALSSLIRIAKSNGEIAQRYANEIQEALRSGSPMVQYHALTLSYLSCKNDRLATTRLLDACIDQDLKSPLAICVSLRMIAKFINDSQESDDLKRYIAYIRDCIDHKNEMVEFEAASTIVSITNDASKKHKFKTSTAIEHLRNFLQSPNPALRFASVRLLNQLAATSSADIRFWSIHRIGNLCKLHLLNRRYKPGDDIIGILDFADSNVICAKYICILKCEEVQLSEMKQEFSLGIKRSEFVISMPQSAEQEEEAEGAGRAKGLILHCVLSFLFYIVDKNYPRTLFEDRAGTIELGPSELETKLFSCDFPIAIYT